MDCFNWIKAIRMTAQNILQYIYHFDQFVALIEIGMNDALALWYRSIVTDEAAILPHVIDLKQCELILQSEKETASAPQRLHTIGPTGYRSRALNVPPYLRTSFRHFLIVVSLLAYNRLINRLNAASHSKLTTGINSSDTGSLEDSKW